MLIGSFGGERKGFRFFLELSLKVVSSARAGLCAQASTGARKVGADQYCGKHESVHPPAQDGFLSTIQKRKDLG